MKESSLSLPDVVDRHRPPTGESGALVVVVDDDRINREILSRMLRKNGCRIIAVDSGIEALLEIDQQLPDLVLLDADMSGLSGFDVLSEIRSYHSIQDLPVIMSVRGTDRQLIVNAFRHGANDYITKPFDPEVTPARIGVHLRLSRSESELLRSQERYALAAEGSRIGLWDWDIVNHRLFLSPRWKEMLGYQANEFDSNVDGWLERIHPEDRATFAERLESRISPEMDRFECEIRIRHRDNSYHWMQCSGVILSDASGRKCRVAGSLADITEGKVRDLLTGLPNRLLFEEQLAAALRRSPRVGESCAVLFLDLDNFKRVNDSYGHDAGDMLICCVAKRIEGCLRPFDQISLGSRAATLARHGGDEFTILLRSVRSRRDVQEIADRVIKSVSEPYVLGAHEVTVGVSVGISFSDSPEKSPAETIREADTAMYYAKAGGRGRYRIFDPDMQTVASARIALESELRQAIKSNQFHLKYQPIIRLANQQVEGVEAFCRWQHPRAETILPEVFVPILETLGLIGRLGRTVLQQACRVATRLNRDEPDKPRFTVAVNCTSREFSQPDFLTDLLSVIASSGSDPRLLRLEITESAFAENPGVARSVVMEMRAAGLRVGIDDFGTGVSSLASLHRLPVDLLKIDRSFVKTIAESEESREIVRTIISLAQSMKVDTVAEGVETIEQERILIGMGCTHAQGFLYSPPVSVYELSGVISSLDPEGRGCPDLGEDDLPMARSGA